MAAVGWARFTVSPKLDGGLHCRDRQTDRRDLSRRSGWHADRDSAVSRGMGMLPKILNERQRAPPGFDGRVESIHVSSKVLKTNIPFPSGHLMNRSGCCLASPHLALRVLLKARPRSAFAELRYGWGEDGGEAFIARPRCPVARSAITDHSARPLRQESRGGA